MRLNGVSFEREAIWMLVTGLVPLVFVALALALAAVERSCAPVRH